MKFNNDKMKVATYIVGIVVAAGGLFSAIFAKDDEDRMREIANEEFDKRKAD